MFGAALHCAALHCAAQTATRHVQCCAAPHRAVQNWFGMVKHQKKVSRYDSAKSKRWHNGPPPHAQLIWFNSNIKHLQNEVAWSKRKTGGTKIPDLDGTLDLDFCASLLGCLWQVAIGNWSNIHSTQQSWSLFQTRSWKVAFDHLNGGPGMMMSNDGVNQKHLEAVPVRSIMRP